MRPEAVAAISDHPKIRTAPTLEDALALLRAEAAPDDAAFVTGSLFLAGEAKGLL